jgi:hypothetical protein
MRIVSNAPNTGSYGWWIPFTLPVKSTYRIQVYSTSDTTLNDFSDAYFSLTASQLKVTVPNGGQQWPVNSYKTITWDHGAASGSTVNINLYDGTACVMRIVSNAPNTGAYGWWIPNDLPVRSAYRIQVYSTSDTTLNDFSDAYFSLTACQLRVTVPNGGEQWPRGTCRAITWDRGANSCSTVNINLYDGNVCTRLATNASNTGSYTLCIPENLPVRCTYRIQVYSTCDTALNDFSDGPFCVTAKGSAEQDLRVVSVTGGGLVGLEDSRALTVEADGGTYPLYYQWRKDGADIKDATDDTLMLASVQESDSGHYEVVVRDAEMGTCTGLAELQVAKSVPGPAPLVLGLLMGFCGLAVIALKRVRR